MVQSSPPNPTFHIPPIRKGSPQPSKNLPPKPPPPWGEGEVASPKGAFFFFFFFFFFLFFFSSLIQNFLSLSSLLFFHNAVGVDRGGVEGGDAEF